MGMSSIKIYNESVKLLEKQLNELIKEFEEMFYAKVYNVEFDGNNIKVKSIPPKEVVCRKAYESQQLCKGNTCKKCEYPDTYIKELVKNNRDFLVDKDILI